MSRIIAPKDTITITIDNTHVPPKCEMRLSCDMPAPIVTLLLSQLISQTMADMINRMSAPPIPPAGAIPFPEVKG